MMTSDLFFLGSCYDGIQNVLTYLHDVQCHVAFSSWDEDTGDYDNSWSNRLPGDSNLTDPWSYQSTLELRTIPYVGNLSSYTGGGYVYQLHTNQSGAFNGLTQLQSMHWIDQYTRAVFLEFSVYNPGTNLITVATILFELSEYGRVFPMYQFFTAKLYHYTSGLETFVAVCEVLFIIYLFIFTRLEYKKFKKLSKKEYFSDTWSYMEIIILVLGYSAIALFFQRLVAVNFIIDEYVNNKSEFIGFYTAIIWDFILTYVMAFLVMCVILKVLKLFRFNKNTRLLTASLDTVKGSLGNYAVVFFIYLLAFASFSWMVFGFWVAEFRDFGHTVMTLINLLLGVSNYKELERANIIFGPTFFFMFTFLMQYCLITVFVAIVLEGFSSTHTVFSQSPPDVPFTKYIMHRIKLFLGVSSQLHKGHE